MGVGCTASDGSTVVGSEHDIDYSVSVSSLSSDNITSPFSGHFNENECGKLSRTLSISYPYGKSIIVIQGTAMVPEFGLSLTSFVMAAALAGVVGVTSIAIKHESHLT